MKLSIIIPVYNSSKILDKLIISIIFHAKKIIKLSDFEIILVNDCSQDDSWNIILELSKKYKIVKGINLARNFGQHSSILAGLKNSKGHKIITMDDDFEHPPAYIKKFFYELDICDACYTYYLRRKHSLIKKAISHLNNLISSFLLNKPIKIYLSSYRGFNKKIKEKIIKYKKKYIYLDYLILINSKKINMISIQHGKRLSGKSNYSIFKLFKLWSSMILSIDTFPLTIHSVFNFFLKLIVTLLFKKNEKKQYFIKHRTFKINN